MLLAKIKNWGFWFIFYLFLALILGVNSFSYFDPDFGWHLRTGEQIMFQQKVPHDQIYMWSLEGQSWVDHEWLANFFIYILWQNGGYILITSFFIILIIASLLSLNQYVFKYYLTNKSHRTIFIFIETIALIGCLPHFGVRVQEFSFFFAIILFIIIDSFRHNKKIKLIFWLIPLLFFWSCLHGGFLFGIAISLGWLWYEIILKFFPLVKRLTNDQPLTNKQLTFVLIIVLLAIISTCLTPYGLELYSFLKDYGQNRYYLSHIEEWRSPYTINFRYDQIIYSLFILVVSGATLAYLKKNFSLWKTVLGITLFLLAMRSVRHFPLWASFSLLFFVPEIIKYHLNDIKLFYTKYLASLTFGCLLLLFFITIIKISPTNKPFTSYCHFYPCGAVQFLKDNPQYGQLKMFNNYGWGGYLIGVWPDKKLFIDGRLPQYKFNHHTLLEEYYLFFSKPDITNQLNKYSINLVLFMAQESFIRIDWLEHLLTGQTSGNQANPLLDYLKNSPDWTRIYLDKTSIIYVRKNN